MSSSSHHLIFFTYSKTSRHSSLLFYIHATKTVAIAFGSLGSNGRLFFLDSRDLGLLMLSATCILAYLLYSSVIETLLPHTLSQSAQCFNNLPPQLHQHVSSSSLNPAHALRPNLSPNSFWRVKSFDRTITDFTINPPGISLLPVLVFTYYSSISGSFETSQALPRMRLRGHLTKL